MIYIGTDDGVYRWMEKAAWPAFHSLQGRGVLGLAAPGRGLLAAFDDTGRVWESCSNGLEWVEVPLPSGAERPVAIASGSAPGTVVLATRPMGVYMRKL
ncbi:MAG TPA: hypothetical protein VGY53_07715, partial [Isosphaeraceae bacterium]|nr:hypothetical protein [Isosphaeraceae bacterium]